jgi:hypothetical protein
LNRLDKYVYYKSKVMLHIINSLSDPLVSLIRDDPVRPEIGIEFRISDSSEIIVSQDEYSKPTAVVCVVYRDSVPRSRDELLESASYDPVVAVFYTIWSYQPGAGRKLIVLARQHISSSRPSIKKYVTLSPPTEMARIFHLRNGAQVLSVNSDSVNYSYE